MALWAGCAADSAARREQVLYYDRNADGRVDQESHVFRAMSDADWELRDDDYDGRYEKKIRYTFTVMESAVDLPVPTHIHIEAKP